ncbi:MAG: acylamino acid-releasing protein, partial [Verrucomicrobiales bacterium]|nr:acylamino acid-releasing protein [Verrucomicrobiales bacterium]
MRNRPLTLSLCALMTGAVSAEQVGPWNLDALKSQVPAMQWVKHEGAVQSLTYAGEKYEGHDTEVFAFYASPITLGEAKP